MKYTWDKSLETGHKLIDSEHQQLFDAINQLLVVCETKKDEELSESLNFLNDYTIKHFFDEEQIQKKNAYPEFENHKTYHNEFKKAVRDLKVRSIMGGPSESLMAEVRERVGDWLVSHIKIHDMKLAAFLKKAEVVAS